MTRPADAFIPTLSRSGNGPVRLGSLLKVLTGWHGRQVSRRALGRLDPHLLRDVGLDMLSAQREADKPFWCD